MVAKRAEATAAKQVGLLQCRQQLRCAECLQVGRGHLVDRWLGQLNAQLIRVMKRPSRWKSTSKRRGIAFNVQHLHALENADK